MILLTLISIRMLKQLNTDDAMCFWVNEDSSDVGCQSPMDDEVVQCVTESNWTLFSHKSNHFQHRSFIYAIIMPTMSMSQPESTLINYRELET